MIDGERGVEIALELVDKNGEKYEIKETVEELLDWVLNQSEEENNSCKQQILPLISQVMLHGMPKLVDSTEAYTIMSSIDVRYILLNLMTSSFYLMKWMLYNEVKINSHGRNKNF